MLPDDLIEEIDRQVGPRRRSAFLVETARAELRRRKLLSFLESDEPAWKAEHDSEIGEDPVAWVRSIRVGSDARVSTPPSKQRKSQATERTKGRNKAG